MATTSTHTTRDIATAALRKSGITSIGDAAGAEDMALALGALNRMLKAWQNSGPNLWAYKTMSLALTTAASYTLSPIRPLSVISARLKRGGIETPMGQMTRTGYDELPLKTSTGLPTSFYYDRQREAAKFYVWPVLATAAGQTVEITYVREMEDVAEGDQVDVPGEYWDCVVYGLAARLVDDYSITGEVASRIIGRAEAELRDARAFDREGSVFFSTDES